METLIVLATVVAFVVVMLTVGFGLMVFIEATSTDSLDHLDESELDK